MSPFAKFLLLIAALFAIGKYGGGYLRSQDFERYADAKKEPWTCQFEIALGKLHFMQDDFDKATMRYSHAVDRCPDTDAAQEAEFEMVRCLEANHQRHAAYDGYLAFVKKYPGTKRARIADRSAQIIQGS